MDNTKPKLSIGLPVFNGENYLAEALDSLLTQTFTDFEIIVSDNNSTDRTEEICLTYAAQDPRIRYYPNEENRGAAWNYNRVFDLAQAEYFKWAAHDDLCAPDLFLRCIEILDNDPSVVLAYSKTRIINERGETVRKPEYRLNTNSSNVRDRFRDLICIPHECFPVFGVIRSEVLRQTPRIGSYTSSDRPLLAELALYGRFYEIPEYLFVRRVHPKSSDIAYRDRHDRTTWFDPAKKGRIVFPRWRVWFEYFRALQRVSLGGFERAACHIYLIEWLHLHWKGMLVDLVGGVNRFLRAPWGGKNVVSH